jgi:hypothetical protein
VSEASLARVGLNFLNDPSHQQPPSRADMSLSQFVLRHQLALTAPNTGGSDDPLTASLANKGHVYAQVRQAWAAQQQQPRVDPSLALCVWFPVGAVPSRQFCSFWKILKWDGQTRT